jgi:hypothetical protein
MNDLTWKTALFAFVIHFLAIVLAAIALALIGIGH